MSTAFTPALEPFFKHPESLVESARIGWGTRIGAFARVLGGAQIGGGCTIDEHTLIEGHAVIGDRVTVKAGVQLWDGVTLEDDVFIGPNATFTNDPFPRSGPRQPGYAHTRVRAGASIGANATILPGLTIGARAMIGAGAVVTRDVPPRAIVVGNPAVVTGYVDDRGAHGGRRLRARESTGQPLGAELAGAAELAGGSKLMQLRRISDARGHLSFAELLPFPLARYFVIFGVPTREVRGEHAHRAMAEFLVCVHGSCSVRMFDGRSSDEVTLDRPDLGLHIPPMVWTTQYKYSPEAVLLVLASEAYRPEDYIRDLDEFLALANKG